MKIYIYSVVLIFCITHIAKADTLSYWHVYYNDLKIKEYVKYSDLTNDFIKLNLKEIKQNDTITVLYYSDTPCNTCKTNIYIIDEKKKNIVLCNRIDERNPMKISVFDLIKYKLQNEVNVYYESDKFKGEILLF